MNHPDDAMPTTAAADQSGQPSLSSVSNLVLGGLRRSFASGTRKPADSLPGGLPEILTAYLERDGRSLNRIAQAAQVDVAYLWRLKRGQKVRPSRDLLIRLALILKVDPGELDLLMLAADCAPITRRTR